jgi:hypothetical protein
MNTEKQQSDRSELVVRLKSKVIQICVEGATTDTNLTLYALLEDGRIFRKDNVGYGGKAVKEQPWVQIEPIPEA